jgi:site-specific DNA-adenine methylase
MRSRSARGGEAGSAKNGPGGLRPFFGFYGGKWRDSLKHYPQPECGTIIEPFAGSAGYSVRYAERKVILGDKDPIIFGVWHYLLHASAADILRLPDLEPGQTVADLAIGQEARWLIGFWLNRGASRPRTGPSAWMRDGIRPGSFWGDRVRRTIASQVDRIRHWKVYNCSYEDLPGAKSATWFVDPPYQQQGKHYRHGADNIDFPALAKWCRSRSGQVIVCENEGADWLPFKALADVKTTRRGSRSAEVVWIRRSTKARPSQPSRNR